MSTTSLLPQNSLFLKQKLLLARKEREADKPTAEVLDHFISEDEVKVKKPKAPPKLLILDPDGRYMIAWRLINLFCICIYLFELPIALVFENTRTEQESIGYVFQIINIPCIVIFTVNMFVKMKLPFYKDGMLITDPKEIYKHYFRFMFVLDIISVTTITAYEISQTMKNSDNVEKALSTLDLLFFVKILEVFEINNLNRNVFQLHRKILATYNIIVLYTSILLISNIMACAFFTISKNSCDDMDVSPDHVSCWVIQTQSANITIYEQVWYIQYIYALYWATTTMLGVGYGDITPKNSHEVAFTIMAEYVACAIFAYSINEVWQIFTEMKQKETRHQKQFNIINRYMRDRQVRSIVSNKVKAYLTHYYRYEKKGDKDKEMEIIDDLAPAIKQELFMDTYGKLFKFKVFSRFSKELFEILIFKIEEMRYPDGEIIQSPEFQEEDPSVSYLFKGSLMSQIQVGTKSKALINIENSQIFGQYQFFTNQITDTILTTKSYCSLYMLKKSLFVKELEDRDYQQYFIIKHSVLLLNKFRYLNMQCFFCGSQHHLSEKCCIEKIKENSYQIIRSYRKSCNQRTWFDRRKWSKVSPISTKNKNIVLMIRNKLESKAINGSTNDLESIQESQVNLHQTHQQGFKSPKKVKNDALRRSQMFQFGKLGMKPKFLKKISMNDGQEQLEEEIKPKKGRPQHLISHLPFITSLVIESTGIDSLESYELYFKDHNIEEIIKAVHKKKGFRQRKS